MTTSAFKSPEDVAILFDDETWGSSGGATWACARDYFMQYREDVIGLTMTLDSPRVFWRAYITRRLDYCIYEELRPIGKPSLGLLSIRVHLEEESDRKHREALKKMNFLEDDLGYWSYNIWSE